jgi:hypothetical protein
MMIRGFFFYFEKANEKLKTDHLWDALIPIDSRPCHVIKNIKHVRGPFHLHGRITAQTCGQNSVSLHERGASIHSINGWPKPQRDAERPFTIFNN